MELWQKDNEEYTMKESNVSSPKMKVWKKTLKERRKMAFFRKLLPDVPDRYLASVPKTIEVVNKRSYPRRLC